MRDSESNEVGFVGLIGSILMLPGLLVFLWIAVSVALPFVAEDIYLQIYKFWANSNGYPWREQSSYEVFYPLFSRGLWWMGGSGLLGFILFQVDANFISNKKS